MIDPPRRIGAAVAGIGIALCVLGWYQIAGQPTVPQQLPYLASATVPGAVLLGTGLVLLLRAPQERSGGRAGSSAPHAAEGAARGGFWRVPDGRYVHTADCPLLDGRTDLIVAGRVAEPSAPEPAAVPELRPCPLCRAGAPADRA
jgi:hypothetical protein